MTFNDFFKGKKVLVTGHTGFKGAWLCIWLKEMGAEVIGYSLDPAYSKNLFDLANLKDKVLDIRADIRNLKELESVFEKHKPDIIFHLAAQPIVRLSYDIPRETFEVNIMGTINVLECLRKYPYSAAVVITSDKCYENVEQTGGYVETDKFSNKDPYSASKGCAELVVQSYRNSFDLKVATARAGNVVGGGDWAKDRLVPDIMRALEEKKSVEIRNPDSVRPWQHVLESLSGYLSLAKVQAEGKQVNEGWNFGPDRVSMVPVKELVTKIIAELGSGEYFVKKSDAKPEAGLLYLDCTKAKKNLGWTPKLDMQNTVKYIVDWYKNYEKEDPYALCVRQIESYEGIPDA